MRRAILAFLLASMATIGCGETPGPVRTVSRADTLFVSEPGRVFLSSKRGGVRVFVNGDLLGASPVEILVAPGDTLSIRIE